MPTIPAFIGQRIGSYRIEYLIGIGQASAAFGAIHTRTRQMVTVTMILLPDTLPQEAFVRFMSRFCVQSEALKGLSHPHLLPVLDYGEYSGYPFLITEATLGLSVAAMLRRHGRCSPEITHTLLTQVASALDYAHSQGIAHGNLTPAMLLLQQGRIQIVGFGMRDLLSARDILEISHPYSYLCNLWGNYLGDPRYLAPECVQGECIDSRSDIYAFGVLLFELLLGSTPFRGRTFIEIATQHIESPTPTCGEQARDIGLSPEIDKVLSKALARQPEKRYQTAGNVVQAYETILQAIPSPDRSQQAEQRRDHFPEMIRETRKRSDGKQEGNVLQTSSGNALREKTPTSATLTEHERARIMIRDIENHIWNGYQLPDPQEPLRRRIWNWLAAFIGG